MKKKTIITITFFNGFAAKNDDNNYHRLFQWFCCEKSDDSNVVTFLYGCGVVKRTMAARDYLLYFFLWSFWSSSLELTINNEMMVFLMWKVVMTRGRRW